MLGISVAAHAVGKKLSYRKIFNIFRQCSLNCLSPMYPILYGYTSFDQFQGKVVVVIGSGQSALEAATSLYQASVQNSFR